MSQRLDASCHLRSAVRVLILLAVASASACVLSPRDEQNITDRTQTFTGFHATPNDRISIQVLNTRTDLWEEVGSTTSSSTAFKTDSCGYSWYPWQATVTLPRNVDQGPYWNFFLGFTTNFIQTRTVASNGALLRGFKSSANECMSKHQCGDAILQNCAIQSGYIVLFCKRGLCQ